MTGASVAPCGTNRLIDFRGVVRAGDTVIWSQGAGEPTTLLERLVEQRHEIGPFRVFAGASYTNVLRSDHADTISFIGLGGIGSNRAICDAGQMDIIPCHLSDLPRFLADGTIRADVVLLQLAAADAEGRFSSGAVNGYAQAALARARVAIAEVNDQAPWTFSRTPVDSNRFDHLVRVSRPLPEIAPRVVSETDRAIAANIVNFIPDGAVLQIGIGAIPSAVLALLRNHRRLGLHSGVIGDGVVDLIELGALDNSTKRVDRGQSVVGGLLGTRRLYAHVHDNRDFLVEPATYTHSFSVLARIEKLVAINSAIEVDVTGQVGAEIAGRSYVGTVGGQVDFVRGALESAGGRSIICLPSRTAKGTGRIVAKIATAVTCARSDADVVITEFGAADLRGQPIRERLRRMIAIAHPNDREALAEASRTVVSGRNVA